MRNRKCSMPVFFVIGVIWAMGSVGLTGCGKDRDAPKYQELTGRVSAIDPSTGAVKMIYYSPKHQVEREVEGTLAPNAEILINGKTTRLEDVRVEDLVRVTGRIEKRDGQKSLVATKVEITRPQAAEAGSASTQPAGTETNTQ